MITNNGLAAMLNNRLIHQPVSIIGDELFSYADIYFPRAKNCLTVDQHMSFLNKQIILRKYNESNI